MAPVLFWFDHQENRKGILRPVGAIEHSEELNGQDSLRFSSWDLPDKYDRILWHDPQDGRWREHVVASASQGITGLCNVRADSSLTDLKAAYVQEIHLNNDTNAEGAQKLLASTAWRVEDNAYERTIISAVYYHMSVYDALFDMVGKFGIDFEPVIYVEGERVSARQIHFAYRLGKGRGLRFQAGRNLHLCRRAASSAELYTALYGWGAALPITDEDGNFTGGYTRRLSFEDYSGNESGLAWVGDDEAREKYGLWNLGRTEKLHRFGDVIYTEVTSDAELYSKTKYHVADVDYPRFTCSAEGALPAGSFVGLGDPVSISNTRNKVQVRYQVRVKKRVRLLGDEVRTSVSFTEPLTWLWNGNKGYGE